MILHICRTEEWHRARDDSEYRPASLESDGFIHCSTSAQVCAVADSLYPGREDLVVLVINEDLIPAQVEFEDLYDMGEEYPHVYGPVPVEAVVQAVPFPPGPDGAFGLPDALVGL